MQVCLASPGSRRGIAHFHFLAQMLQASVSFDVTALSEDQMRQWYADKVPIGEIARRAKVSRWVVRRVLGL